MMRNFTTGSGWVARVVAALLILGCSAGASGAAGGRVVSVHHAGATVAFTPQAQPISTMIERGLTRFAGKSSSAEAWQSLISTQEVIGIKVHSAPGRTSGTRPMVVAALIESLLRAGFEPGRIVVWDRRLVDLRLAGYFELAERYQVTVAGALEQGYDAQSFYTSSLLGRLVFGDLEFGKRGEGIGRNSYVTTLLTRKVTKIINVSPLLNHNLAGVSGMVYNLAMASVDNILRFEDPERLATAVPEIYALPELADRVVLNITDALICQYRGEERSLLHYSTPYNELWFSQDPVALDLLALEELERQRPGEKEKNPAQQIYLNAGLLDLGVSSVQEILRERIVVP